jgi:hypothetical protein
MGEHAAPSRTPNGWLWLIVAGVCFLGIVGAFAGSFVYAAKAVGGSGTDLAIDGSVCRTRAEWSSAGMLFLREHASVSAADALAAVSARDAAGNTIQIRAVSGTSLDIHSGVFDSIGAVDFSGVPPETEICIETAGLGDTLEEGDLLLVGDFASPLVTAVLSSCGVSIVLGVGVIVGLAKARAGFGAR